MERKTREYQTDVLVLGSSSAGCGAAITAARAGAEVLLLDKGHLESSGCLGGGNDHFMAVLDEVEHVHHDHFTDVFPDTNWTSCLEHAKALGLGTDEYELIQI